MIKFFQILIAAFIIISAVGCNIQNGYRIHSSPNARMSYYDYGEYPRNKRAHECEVRNFNPECRDSNRRHSGRREHGRHHHRRHHH